MGGECVNVAVKDLRLKGINKYIAKNVLEQ